MSFLDELQAFQREFDAFYSTYPADVSAVEQEMDTVSAQHPQWSSYRRKALIYEASAEHCQVQLFRHFPFYYELAGGRDRNQWGFGGIGAWLMRQPSGQEYTATCQAWKPPYTPFVAFNGWDDVDRDHHCVGYDNVLALGLRGLMARAQERLSSARTEKERAFLEAVLIGHRALIRIAERFAERAEEMLRTETAPPVRRRLERIARSARRSPANPPETFYEALNTILFMREIIGSLEGIGVSTFGQLDRMLEPYYRRDLETGLLTPDEALDLVRAFLAMTDAKFEVRLNFAANGRGDHMETSTTVFIGGCDAQGTPIFNDITRMVLQAYREMGLMNPKLHARVSPGHPPEYHNLLAEFIAAGTNVLAVYNDDVIIQANVAAGKRVEDARLYVGGGCQENILQNTEINSRATMFLSLGHVFDMGMFPKRWAEFARGEGLELIAYQDCPTFEDCYRAFLHNLKSVVDRLIAHRNANERNGWLYNPCPLHSSTVDDCITKAMDITEGGARYSTGAVDLAGLGTLIDSLVALREVIYRQQRVSWPQLQQMLTSNFQGEEAFRQYLANRVQKFGDEGDEMRAFAAQVVADLAAATSGQPNSRGGRYVASLFAHRSFVGHGHQLGATPDGRRAGEALSPGISPSLLSLGQQNDIGHILYALEPLDFAQYPVIGVLDLKMPVGLCATRPEVIVPVIRRFIQAGGQVMQINVVDPAILLEAQAHPERHPDLIVRVSGYSTPFATLPRDVQDEIIQRTLVA